jgi:hypothetical protein
MPIEKALELLAGISADFPFADDDDGQAFVIGTPA